MAVSPVPQRYQEVYAISPGRERGAACRRAAPSQRHRAHIPRHHPAPPGQGGAPAEKKRRARSSSRISPSWLSALLSVGALGLSESRPGAAASSRHRRPPHERVVSLADSESPQPCRRIARSLRPVRDRQPHSRGGFADIAAKAEKTWSLLEREIEKYCFTTRAGPGLDPIDL